MPTVRHWKSDMKKIRQLDSAGVPRAEIARQYGVPRQVITKALGPRQKDPGNAKEHHIYCRPESFEDVSDMVKSSFGFTTHGGPKAGLGSIGALVDAIAAGRIALVPVEGAV